MAIVLFDNLFRERFLPISATRALADLRFGMFTVRERWHEVAGQRPFVKTVPLLQPLYGEPKPGLHFWIDPTVHCTKKLWEAVIKLAPGEALVDGLGLVAGHADFTDRGPGFAPTVDDFSAGKTSFPVKRISSLYEIVQGNAQYMAEDFAGALKNKISMPVGNGNHLVAGHDVFVESGAKVSFSVLNAENGPIYIGKGATVMEGCLIRGPFSLGANGLLKMGSKIYGAVSMGPNCVGGGEIKNSIMLGNSNKAHDGYLGDSYIGEWCNFGAGTSNSNVKNTGGEVRLWDESAREFVNAGMKCGLFMGDYSRSAINSSFNTGSYIGVCCNVFGNGLLPKVIPSFTWGTSGQYRFDKALSDIANWKKMKGQALAPIEAAILEQLFAARPAI